MAGDTEKASKIALWNQVCDMTYNNKAFWLEPIVLGDQNVFQLNYEWFVDVLKVFLKETSR